MCFLPLKNSEESGISAPITLQLSTLLVIALISGNEQLYNRVWVEKQQQKIVSELDLLCVKEVPECLPDLRN